LRPFEAALLLHFCVLCGWSSQQPLSAQNNGGRAASLLLVFRWLAERKLKLKLKL